MAPPIEPDSGPGIGSGIGPDIGPERAILAERARLAWCPGFVAELARRLGTADRAQLLLARAGIDVEWPADRGDALGPLLYRVFQHRVHRPEVMGRLFDALEAEYEAQPWTTGLRHGYEALPGGDPAPLPAVAPGLLDTDERRHLDVLLADPRCPTEPDRLCEVLWAAASSLGLLVAKDGLLAAERAASVTALVDDLDARNSPDTRVPPLLVFLEHLAARAEDPVRDELRDWIDTAAHRLAGRRVESAGRQRAGRTPPDRPLRTCRRPLPGPAAGRLVHRPVAGPLGAAGRAACR
ncbi:hypothetical protein ACH4TX_36015 [Streptomyces sp. NPDC021098]|uniref:hypothetical protein n=1 Tax=unclassified Streptomyces TaxID=2593676 RepID=UPI0037920F75